MKGDKTMFGEIAMLTRLKRTATVTSDDYTQCAYLTTEDINDINHWYPHIFAGCRSKILQEYYTDKKMQFRRKMIQNVHFLKDLKDEIINEIICHLEVKRFAQGEVILKNGDVSSSIMFLREGNIQIKVNNQKS